MIELLARFLFWHWLGDVLPDAVKKVPASATLVQRCIVTVHVAEYLHVLLRSLGQKLAQVSEIAVASQQTEAGELVLVGVLHGLHDDGHVDFRLHLQIEARLAHVAVLVGAEDLLTLEGANVDCEALLRHLLVELLAMPDRRLAAFGCHVVHVIEARLRLLLHVLDDYPERLRVALQLALSLLLKRLGALEQIGAIDDEYAASLWLLLADQIIACHLII